MHAGFEFFKTWNVAVGNQNLYCSNLFIKSKSQATRLQRRRLALEVPTLIFLLSAMVLVSSPSNR
jgi:hypothetical protein